MNAQETTETRELTADELTAVSGGRSSTTTLSETTINTENVVKALGVLIQQA